MGLRLTTKVQVSGWRFLLRRVEHALVRRDTRMFDDPLQFYGRSTTIGALIAVAIVLGAGVLAYFKPGGTLGGGRLFADGTSFQLYVDISGRMHPVYNLTSARLVLGDPAEPAVVKPSELTGLPQGQWVGIPGAPHDTPVTTTGSSQWGVCDTVTGPSTFAPVVDTSVIARALDPDDTAQHLRANQAVLATFGPDEWVITEQGRHFIDRSNRALTTAVGIPSTASADLRATESFRAAAVPISEGLFNALPDAGAWHLPPVPAAGQPNTLGLPPELVIGSVFETATDAGPQHHLVLPDGVAPVGQVTAAALRATESFGLVAPPQLPISEVVTLPEAFYPSPLPEQPIEVLSRADDPVLCWLWQRNAAEQAPQTSVTVGRQLPIPDEARDTGISQVQGTATVYTDGGKYLQLQSLDPQHGEALYYLDAQGVRYGLPDTATAEALGLSAPELAPWPVVRLLVDGPVLARDAALQEHDTLAPGVQTRTVATGEDR